MPAPFALLTDVADAEDTVESIEGLRGIIDRESARVAVEVPEVVIMVGEVGGLSWTAVASTGADTLRCTAGWLYALLFRASSLNASLLTALRSSSAGLGGTRFAGLGDRTPPVVTLRSAEVPTLGAGAAT